MSYFKLSRFVLLKERNMLLTMLHNYKEATANMPNEERLDKVQENSIVFGYQQ